MALNEKEVSLIEADVKNAGLIISVLQEELVDHVCCEVETLMSGGKDFTEAYTIVKNKVNIGTLQSIEKNTFLLIDKKYALMKLFMKISANISLAFIAIGTLLKIYGLLGANIILVAGFAILCVVFIPSLIYSFRKDHVNKFLFKISALTGSIAFACGILFKAMYWTGGNMLLVLAYALFLLVSLPALLIDISKHSQNDTTKGLDIFGVISLMIFVLSTMLKMFHLPGALIFMILGTVSLVSIYLPVITYREFKKSGIISGRFIFMIILSIYVLTISMLMSFQAPAIQNIISLN
jgi:hypothetical protein